MSCPEIIDLATLETAASWLLDKAGNGW